MPRYAELIYYGFWFSPEREMLQAMIDKRQEHVEGTVRLKLYKGNVIVTGRKSPKSLYSDALVTFEDDRGAYDQKDAEGFIRLNALRLRTLAARKRNDVNPGTQLLIGDVDPCQHGGDIVADLARHVDAGEAVGMIGRGRASDKPACIACGLAALLEGRAPHRGRRPRHSRSLRW